MRRKIIALLKAAARKLIGAVEDSARVQKKINAARSEFYQKHPEALIRRGIL